MNYVFSMVASLALLVFASASVSAEEYWNQFRGAHNGASSRRGLPERFGEGDNVLWKTPIHGKGWSSPVVWGDQIWLTTAPEDGRQLYAVCVDLKSGEIQRDILVFEVANPRYCHETNSYASPTPFVEAGRVYVHFGAYGTACIDTATGEKLWERRDFECDDFRGPGSSPIVDGERLYVHFDGVDRQYVVALDKQTGETIWKRDRDIDFETTNGDRKKAYGTPLLIEHQGRRQLISPAAMETIAYAPTTGETLWRVRHGGMNAAARPMFGNDLIYLAAGQGQRSLIAVRPDGVGPLDASKVVWGTSQATPRRPSQTLHDGMLFMINDGGVASCLDALTGEVLWRERLDGEYWASPLAADGRIYFFSKDGAAPVVAATREFKRLADNRLDDGFVASPAVAERSLIVRSKKHLYRLGAP